MNGQSSARKGDLIARREWTARLNRFASAKTAKQRRAALDGVLKINPGKTLRDLLQAWGYSASARGRKPKAAQPHDSSKTARERLELTLDQLFGTKPTPVPSLYAKLAGRTDTTVKDACRIVAALIVSWPERMETMDDKSASGETGKATRLAELFIRELLSQLSSERSHQWTEEDLEVHIFRLVDEERVGVSHFIKDAGAKEGALIVAGARNILLGSHPVDIVRQFHSVTSEFIGGGDKGILIFVFDAAIFEAGKEGFHILDNVGLLSTAITAFALFPENYGYKSPIVQHRVDWSRWRNLSTRCCVVIRKPPFVDPLSGQFLKQSKFDEFMASWQPDQAFARLEDLRGFVRFDSTHVLPHTYPPAFGHSLSDRDLYWDVLVRPAKNEPEGLEVQYFIPRQQIAVTGELQIGRDKNNSFAATSQRGRGRPPAKTISIEEDFFYVIRQGSPGPRFDDAQRAIYMAARGRLNVDTGESHASNLNAAAALRQNGYEVLPISAMISLFPRLLNLVASNSESAHEENMQRDRN